MAQDRHTFRLRLVTGWMTILLFVAICAFCGYVIISNSAFNPATVTVATSALLVEALGLIIAVIKGLVGQGPKEVEPTTSATLLSGIPASPAGEPRERNTLSAGSTVSEVEANSGSRPDTG
jgi:hypothetical protein